MIRNFDTHSDWPVTLKHEEEKVIVSGQVYEHNHEKVKKMTKSLFDILDNRTLSLSLVTFHIKLSETVDIVGR